MDGAEDLVQAEPVFHRQDKFGQEVAGMFADDRDPENPVLAGHGQDLDKAMGRPVGDGPIEISQVDIGSPRRRLIFGRLLLV